MKLTKIPEIIFGKKHLVEKGFFDDGEIGYSDGNCTMYPAIRGGNCKAEVIISNDVPIHIFSNGSEADGWLSCNCYECPKRNEFAATAMNIRKDGGCALELRLAIAQADDGKIPFKAVKRIGYTYLSVQENGIFAHLSPCNEKP